jgi:site-specific recombinase XerD
MGRKSQIPEIEAKLGQSLKPYLTERIKEGKSPQDIKDLLGVSLSQVYDLIKFYELKEAIKEARRVALLPVNEGELKALVDKFLQSKVNSECSELTVYNLRVSMNSFIWWIEHTDRPATLANYTPQTISDYLNYLKTEPVRFGGIAASSRKPMKPISRLKHRTHHKNFGNWLVLHDHLEKNPVDKVEKIKVSKEEPEDLPDEILEKVMAGFNGSFNGLRDKNIVSMFLSTGMRLAGLESLKIDTFDLDTGWGKIIEKGKKTRRIKLPPSMRNLLREYITARGSLAKSDYLWVHPDGNRFARGSIKDMVNKLNDLYDSGERRIHPHLFRHLWAKNLARAQVNPLSATIGAGWEDIKLYMYYARAYTAANEAWDDLEKADTLNRYLKGAGNAEQTQAKPTG